jgi:TPR repeat protein
MITRVMFGVLLVASAAIGQARAESIQAAIAAYDRHDNATAARIFLQLAERGDAKAQLNIGLMYAKGDGVPQNFAESASWYQLASERGEPTAQYLLGLMFDKRQGVPQDYVLAYKWLNLATAAATGRTREDWVRIRDAVASKLSLVERTKGQQLAAEWQASRRQWR